MRKCAWWVPFAATVIASCASPKPSPRVGPVIELPIAAVGESALAWRQVDDHPNHIFGKVLLADSLQPATGASVWAKVAGGRDKAIRGPIGPDGAFDLLVPGPGQYDLRVARIGYAVARADVIVTKTTGVAVTAVLVPLPMVLHSDIF